MNKTKIIALSLILSLSGTSAFAKTKVSTEIAGTFSNYKYEEPNIMSLKGNMYGIDARFNIKPEEDRPLFFGVQLALSAGTLDYKSNDSGTMKGEDDNKQEFRLLVGMNQDIFSPYVGLGYRRLVDDSSGMTTSTGDGGYKRTSQYYYMPIGFAIDVFSNNQVKIKTKLEYDYLIRGQQESDLTSFGYNPGVIKNTQKNGYGYRFSVQVNTPVNKDTDLFVEPYYEYWNISESKTATASRGGATSTFIEPANNTEEFGMKIGVGF